MATFDFAAMKAKTRQIVHDTMATEAIYTHPNFVGSEELRIRWHNKVAHVGELLENGYSSILEGVNRVIFNIPELDKKGITLQLGGRLALVNPLYGGAVLILDSKEPRVGPIEEIWFIRHDR